MRNSEPLLGEKIILTGTKVTHAVLNQIEQLGGRGIHLPLITVHEVITESDEALLTRSMQSDWLIFTSQNAVRAFANKMKRYEVTANAWRGRVAVVGAKTTQAIEKSGFQIDFMPTIFSADVFVQEFPLVAEKPSSCLFLKGSMAKDTIKVGLPFDIDEWTVYETIPTAEHTEEMKSILAQTSKATVIFASPSAVEVFTKHVATAIGWDSYTVAAIGHVTEDALKRAGATAIVKPSTYTMSAIIEELANRKEHQL